MTRKPLAAPTSGLTRSPGFRPKMLDHVLCHGNPAAVVAVAAAVAVLARTIEVKLIVPRERCGRAPRSWHAAAPRALRLPLSNLFAVEISAIILKSPRRRVPILAPAPHLAAAQSATQATISTAARRSQRRSSPHLPPKTSRWTRATPSASRSKLKSGENAL